MITLNDGNSNLVLHPDLFWQDENNWNPVEQAIQRTVTGALVVSAATRLKGRPITLAPQGENSAWMPRATLDTLRNWASVPGKQMVLTLRGTATNVIFRHHETAIEASPIQHFSDVDGSDWYLVTLRFMEI
jgi:hypothetical protein